MIAATPPYAEIGRAGLVSGSCAYTQLGCTDPFRFAPGQTRAAGLGAGAELTLWRVAVDMSFRNIWMREAPSTPTSFLSECGSASNPSSYGWSLASHSSPLARRGYSRRDLTTWSKTRGK